MALIRLNYPSQALAHNTEVTIILPDPDKDQLLAKGKAKGKYQVLYLLHGTHGDHTDWSRYTAIERYARERCLAVVMPSCGNAFYQDMVSGPQYKTFLLDELPNYLSGILPLSREREDVFIAGLSMGGYGALHLALSRPRQFMAAASLSGVFTFSMPLKEEPVREDLPWPFMAMIGDLSVRQIDRSRRNVLVQAKQLLDKKEPLPALFISVGTEDFTLNYNRDAKRRLSKMGAAFTYEEHPGAHTWAYWDTHIQRVLDWLPLKKERV
ncbi:MAG: esterase family protein [Clostridiales bacterium]|nr:esterase family protein [Clostridiales bacterium]